MHALREMGPDLCAYVLSFVLLGIYWNNHHLLVGAMRRVSAGVLWANLHLLFWLSLVPFATAWMGRNPHAPFPIAVYGGIAFLAAVAYTILQMTIIAADGHGSKTGAGSRQRHERANVARLVCARDSARVRANHGVCTRCIVLVALIWLVPDRRIAAHEAPSESQCRLKN